MAEDATLEAEAQAYADTCPTGHASSSARNGAGENLYWAGGSGIGNAAQSYHDAAEAWYEEISDYDFSSGQSTGGVIGHFTQMVWRAIVFDGKQRVTCFF